MPTISVADDVLTSHANEFFDYDEGAVTGWECAPYFLVAAPDGDHTALLPAIRAACRRFLFVDDYGREVSLQDADDGANTPGGVTAHALSAHGVAVSADTGGFLSVPMGTTMVRVLVEELTALGRDAHISHLADDVDLATVERIPVL